MSWFNYIGLVIILIILLPNILYAIKFKDGFNNHYKNKVAELFEQIGRYGCLFLMIFNVPYTYFNFWFDGALLVYILVNVLLCIAYLICWVIFWQKTNLEKALLLSVLPSCIFLFSGVMLLNIPLIIFAGTFAPCHILISCKNAIKQKDHF